ncbi:MAG: hypothetical protein LUC50_00770 [Ruminococcus sp.]|nr:hypothetical protein [Ruminococcus sp.]
MADYTLSAKVSADASGFTSAMKTAQNSLAAFSSKCSSIGATISKLGDKLSTIGTYATATIVRKKHCQLCEADGELLTII